MISVVHHEGHQVINVGLYVDVPLFMKVDTSVADQTLEADALELMSKEVLVFLRCSS